ncbi:hypothetical protein [Thiomicrorhabdus aquaedulcis]|nr:hypothetical protein [Thiomicrorhabdus aquaedulcis]
MDTLIAVILSSALAFGMSVAQPEDEKTAIEEQLKSEEVRFLSDEE